MDKQERRERLAQIKEDLSEVDCSNHGVHQVAKVLDKLVKFLEEEESFIEAQGYSGSGYE